MDILDKKDLRNNIVQGSLTTPKKMSCRSCGLDTSCRRRTFSEQAWSALLAWGEATVDVMDQPICNTCYQEMRETLMDRADEIESKDSQSSEIVEKVRARLSSLAG